MKTIPGQSLESPATRDSNNKLGFPTNACVQAHLLELDVVLEGVFQGDIPQTLFPDQVEALPVGRRQLLRATKERQIGAKCVRSMYLWGFSGIHGKVIIPIRLVSKGILRKIAGGDLSRSTVHFQVGGGKAPRIVAAFIHRTRRKHSPPHRRLVLA